MNPLVQVLQKALRDELIVAREWIENEIFRLGGGDKPSLEKIAEIVDRAVPRHDPISPPPHWGNGHFQKEETNR